MSFPNQLSVLRIFLTPLFLYLFLSENIVYKKLSLIVFFIAVATDCIDVWHAIKYGLISAFGIFIDPLADKILTSAAFAGFYILGIMPLWMVIVIVSRDIIITLLRSYKEYKGYTMKTSFAAKTKTFIQMAYIFLLIIFICALSFQIDDSLRTFITEFIHSDINYYLMLLITLLTFYTGITYFFESNNTEGVSG
ncbi:MAG: CDP-alcohol phosphatidyltransferase family protein [Ignavibacteria bacterium]|nr:CDP-alcohol phosphatidyltransferase family protein [Ignavibacteria bacterium]